MAGYNRVIMAGNLTRDPELRQAGAGTVCRLSIASNRQYKNRQTGALVQEVCYIDVDVWGVQAESCNQYLRKGRPVLIEGRLKFDTWKEGENQLRSKHSIVADRVIFLGTSTSPEVSQETSEETGDTFAAKRIVSPVAAASKEESEPLAGTPLFKDEPPFQDDLPF